MNDHAFDIIGDIHGCADALKLLLCKLGYSDTNGIWKHPTRRVLFVGDYIDRGPKIPETLEIVKSMVDSGTAIALMGNHEYNAICFHMKRKGGGHLRPHSIKNILQHKETLRQFHHRQDEYDEYIEWFKTLPLWYENDHFRAVHACWDNDNIDRLKGSLGGTHLSEEHIIQSSQKDHKLFTLIEETLKGKEITLPNGISFIDKDGNTRHEMRIKWWLDPSVTTIRDYSIIDLGDKLPEEPMQSNNRYYAISEKPVFFGHYWLKGKPTIYRDNVCCLDYSIAKGGKLVAYQYDGKSKLSNDKLIHV